MHLIQTLYISETQYPYKYSFGWVSPEHHLMAWCFSCLQLNKLGYTPSLYCNDTAGKLLINDLKLPYAEVYLTHNDLYLPDKRLWALPKIYTYGLQTRPFLHIDGDVFLFEKLPSSLLESQLVAQNMEEATAYYTEAQNSYMQHFSYFPPEVQQDFFGTEPIKAVNAGVLGGTNVSFFEEYSSVAIEYVSRNEQHMGEVAINQFNVFFEQHLCHAMAKSRGINFEFLLNQDFKDNEYTGLANFHETPIKRNYLHLLGHFKRDPFACYEMAAHFRALYPEYYYRVMDCCRKHQASLRMSFSSVEEQAESFQAYQTLCERAVTVFETSNLIGERQEANYALSTEWAETYKTLHESIKFQVPDAKLHYALLSDLNIHEASAARYFGYCGSLKEEWMLGRDIEAVGWWRQLFGDDIGESNRLIQVLPHHYLLKSAHNWGALIYGMHAEARPFYQHLSLEPGDYYTLFVPQAGAAKMAVYDIEDVEYLILLELQQQPLSFPCLLEKMQKHADEDVLLNHVDSFRRMIALFVEQLLLKKAICPVASSK